MRRFVTVMVLAYASLAVHGAVTRQDPALPSGHPPIDRAVDRPGAPPVDRPDAHPQDVHSVESIVGAYYGSISGGRGAARDWGRFRALFVDGAMLVTGSPAAAGAAPMAMSPQQFVELNDEYFTGSGYIEQSIHMRATSFGNVAQVFSTYESRRLGEDAPYSRGVNGFQLVRSGGRWWIASLAWDRERGDSRLGPEHLPPGG